MINTPADLLDFHPTLRHIRKNGACQDAEDPDDFFPGVGTNAQLIVRDYCNNCPVIAECLEWAIANHEQGIWAATTDRQRAAMRRQRGIA